MSDSAADHVAETEAQRAERHARRRTFGSVAALYEATRQGYPPLLVAQMVSTAGVEAGDSVLEIGCGTGQLTRQLIAHRFKLTCVDLSGEMVDVARAHPGMKSVEFVVAAFEDFNARPASYDLVVSATAFHWVDPDTGLAKVARLLRPRGWMAWLGVREVYDPPLGPALRELYIARSTDGGAWAVRRPSTEAEVIAATGLFQQPHVHDHSERTTLSADTVLGVELTRATTLSYDGATRASFRDELSDLLASMPDVAVELHSRLTMARVR